MILSADMSIMLDRILDVATDNLRFAKILVQMGLDPNNVTWDAIFNRLLEIFLHNITLANMFALVGAIFFVATLISYEKLLEIYFQNPQFGYYFLVLTSQRLLKNLARAEAIIAQNKIAAQTPFAN